MTKRVITVVLATLLIASLSILWQRHVVESNNRTVSLLMDGMDMIAHARTLDVEPDEYFAALREAGLFGVVAVYDNEELRLLVKEAGLGLVLLFHKEPLDEPAGLYDLTGVAGVAFNSSEVTDAFLGRLDLSGQLLFLIQRNDTARGYLPSPVHEELIATRYPAVRTYRISRWETDSAAITPDNMPHRWLMHVREYNTRALYSRPFFDSNLKETAAYVRAVSDIFLDNGYIMGLASPFPAWYPSRWLLVMAGAGVVFMSLLAAAIVGLPGPLLSLAAAGGGVALVGVLIPVTALPARLSLALGGSIAASVLGLLWLGGRAARRYSWFRSFLTVNGITLTGALCTAAILSDRDFLMEYYFFRGVKLQYLLPLAILGVYLLFAVVGREGIREAWRWPWFIKLAGVAVVFLVVALYLIRSGDVQQITPFEEWIRLSLDRLLVMRPRFKELISYPLLLLTLFHRKRLPRVLYAGGIMVGAIGQVSLVNTFLHLRTPLLLSLLRSFHGLWLGTLLGLILIAVSSKFIALFARRPEVEL